MKIFGYPNIGFNFPVLLSQGWPEGDVPLHPDADQRQEDRLVSRPRQALRVHHWPWRGSFLLGFRLWLVALDSIDAPLV